MTATTEEFGETWDLLEVVSERAQPKDTVSVYLNEIASYAKGEIMKEMVAKKDDLEALGTLSAELEKIEAQLEATKYTLHITAIPSRMREDIASRAMQEFPLKLDLLGRDDPINAIARNKHETKLSWHAQVYDIVNPKGLHKNDFTLEQMNQFAEALGTEAQKAVDRAIESINKRAEEYSVASKSVDFS